MENTTESQLNWVSVLCEGIRQFFGSSIFFIVLGIGFLGSAYYLIARTHPSFVFLMAILGVSIVLYGTGTQGVGSAEMKDVPIKAVIAGGAGVLAAVFGYGVALLSPQIKDVFGVSHEYARVVLTLTPGQDSGSGQIVDLRKVYVSASLRGTSKPLHVLPQEDSIEVLVPVTYWVQDVGVCLTLTLPPDKPLASRTCPALEWHDNTDKADSDLITKIGRGSFQLVPIKPRLVDEHNNPVATESTVFR